jgi:hypothetical protein
MTTIFCSHAAFLAMHAGDGFGWGGEEPEWDDDDDPWPPVWFAIVIAAAIVAGLIGLLHL